MRIIASAFVAAVAFASAVTGSSAATLSFDAVQFPGTGVPLTVTGSDGTVFTFTAGPSSQFQSFSSSGISYPTGTFFLAPGLGNTTPINISFSAPLTTFTVPVSSDRTGNSAYTSTVNLFNGASLVNSLTASGNTSGPASIFSATGLFTSASISTFVANAPFGFTENLGPISYIVAVPGPLAGAGLLPLFGFAGAWLVRRRRQSAALAA